MAAVFNPDRPYRRDRDVRARSLEGMVTLMMDDRPHGPLWPLVASRRAGKTWALEGIRDALVDGGRQASVLDLRTAPWPPEVAPPAGACLLLDEPATRLGAEKNKKNKKRGDGGDGRDDDGNPGVRLAGAEAFIAECAQLYQDGVRILLAVSPAEWSLLRPHIIITGTRDRQELAPLFPEEQETLAGRIDWGSDLLAALPSGWRGNPFLLELLLAEAEHTPELREPLLSEAEQTPESRAGNLRALLAAATLRAGDPKHDYVSGVFDLGLDEDDRVLLRAVARGEPADAATTASNPRPEVLAACGLLTADRRAIADPLLAAHLPPPLRIHHVSDVHVGPKSAGLVDVKAPGRTGRRVADAAGAGPARDSYLDRLAELANEDRAPHLLVVSGDLAEYGDAALYQQVRAWLGKAEGLLAAHPDLRDGEPRVLLVGGNHDVDWNATDPDELRARHQPFADAFAGYPHPHLEKPPPERVRDDDGAVEYPDAGVSFLLLGSAELGGEVEKSTEWAYVRREMRRLRNLVDRARRDGSRPAKVLELLDQLSRVDPGLVHNDDLRRARTRQWRGPVNIAIVHHPVSPLPAVEIAQYAGMVNAGVVKDVLLAKKFCLLLHGHQHMGWFGCEQWPSHHGDWRLRIAAAPSLGSREVTEEHGFNEIEIVREGVEYYEVTVRQHVRKGWTWSEKPRTGTFTPGGPDLPRR